MEVIGLRERVHDQMARVWADLAELVSIRSVAAEPAESVIAQPTQIDECGEAAEWILSAFAATGMRDVRLVATPGRAPAVYGHRPGPQGAPTVLLYAHYDVRPATDEEAWQTPPFQLTEREGRWYGRGAADCKGNVMVHLTALRALGDKVPVSLKLIVDGGGEDRAGGLATVISADPEMLRADAIVVCDAGNVAVGVPTVTTAMRGSADVVVTVDSLTRPVPAGAFGGPTPDALAALIQMLSTLRDTKGNTTVRGLYSGQKWMGVEYPSAQLRRDASVLDPVALLGDGALADMVWARPAVTVAGIDCPPVDGRSPRIQPTARAHVNLRVPPAMDPGKAQEALVNHLDSVAPWDVRVSYSRLPLGSPFRADTDGPAFSALGEAMHEAYGKQMAMGGAGGSMASCNLFADAYPDAEIIVIGVRDPLSLAHAANESVDPGEVEHMALSEALFLHRFAMTDAP